MSRSRGSSESLASGQPASAFIYFEAMAPKIQALKHADIYMELIKTHLKDPRHTTLHWNCVDMAVVVAHHEKFLCDVAMKGVCIHVQVFAKCLTNHFRLASSEARSFARKLASALSFCRAKTKKGRNYTGVNTSSAVHAVIMAIRESRDPLDADSGVISSDEEAAGEGKEDEGERSPLALCDASLPATPDILCDGSPSSPIQNLFWSEEEDAPATPPSKHGAGDAEAALQTLKEAFGEPKTASSSTMCTSMMVLDSPVSVASSRGGSPTVCEASASQAFAPDLPGRMQVQCGGGMGLNLGAKFIDIAAHDARYAVYLIHEIITSA